MVEEVKSYDAEKLMGVSKAFSHFLALSNTAENQHRIRRLKESLKDSMFALPSKEDSCAGSIKRLLTKHGISADEIYAALSTQQVEIVLTGTSAPCRVLTILFLSVLTNNYCDAAHPTEVNRRTMLQKHQRIQDLLLESDRTDLINYEQRMIDSNLNSEITSIWKSDELRRSKPTPVKEAKAGLAIVENVLWNAVPDYLRKLDDVVQTELGRSLPLDVAPIKFASWMGGDRDGNPNVTPEITLEVV